MSAAGESKDYYEVLGASEDATAPELERLYKRLAVRHHPDRGGDEERMKTLNEAYGVLGNVAARADYDASRGNGNGSRKRPETAAPAQGEAYVRHEPAHSAPAQADAIGGRLAGAGAFLFLGVALMLLVRFQYFWFLFPLALLAAGLVLAGVMLAHAALVLARESVAPTHIARRFVWAQETIFWSAVGGGVYGVYLIMSAV